MIAGEGIFAAEEASTGMKRRVYIFRSSVDLHFRDSKFVYLTVWWFIL